MRVIYHALIMMVMDTTTGVSDPNHHIARRVLTRQMVMIQIPALDPWMNLGTLPTSLPHRKHKTPSFCMVSPRIFMSKAWNVKWYSDKELLDLVYTGNQYTAGHTEPGKYTYYVTQTLSGCESAADDISLSIVTEIPPPSGHDTVIDIGEPAIITR